MRLVLFHGNQGSYLPCKGPSKIAWHSPMCLPPGQKSQLRHMTANQIQVSKLYKFSNPVILLKSTFLKDFVQHSFAALSAGLKSLEEGWFSVSWAFRSVPLDKGPANQWSEWNFVFFCHQHYHHYIFYVYTKLLFRVHFIVFTKCL